MSGNSVKSDTPAALASDPLVPLPVLLAAIHRVYAIQISLRTLRGWIERGIAGGSKGDSRIRLRCDTLGGRILSRWSWLSEFLSAVRDAKERRRDRDRSPSQRPSHKAAKRRLREACLR